MINQTKESARQTIRAAIQNAQAEVVCESNDLHTVIAQINYLLVGSASGTDTQLISCCQSTIVCLSRAIMKLNQCLSLANQLDVMEDSENE